MNRQTSNATNQIVRGFTLIEVLVALVILSIGLLGIAGMITTSLKTNDGAYLRTEANTLAYSILDRMRTNRATATQGGYDIAIGTAGPVSAACLNSTTACTSTQLTALCMGAGANCTPAQMAAADVSLWKQELAYDLPAGDGSIKTALNAQGVISTTIVVQWNPSRATQALGNTTSAPTATTTSFTVTSGL